VLLQPKTTQILCKLLSKNEVDGNPSLQQQAKCTEYGMQILVICKQKERAAVHGVSGSAAPQGSSTSHRGEMDSGSNKSESNKRVVEIVATRLDNMDVL
jgi:hypothetical protein